MQDNVGFGWGFGIPAAVMILAIIVFFCGASLYRYKQPRGSPLTSVVQVVVAAARNRKSKHDDDSMVLYEGPTEGQRPVEMLAHTDQFRFVIAIRALTAYNALLPLVSLSVWAFAGFWTRQRFRRA